MTRPVNHNSLNRIRRIAMLIELPNDLETDSTSLRRFLKALLRSYGMRCLSIKPPAETKTFGTMTTTDTKDKKEEDA